MMNFRFRTDQFLQNEDGQTAIEYAVMLALIVAVCVGAVNTLASAARNNFDRSSQHLGKALVP